MLQKKIFWLTCLICLLTLTGISKIEISTNYHQMFNQDSAEFKIYQSINQTFKINEVNAITLHSEEGIFTESAMTLINRLSAWAETLPEVSNVNSLTRLILPLTGDEHDSNTIDVLTLYEQLEQEAFSDTALAQIKKNLLSSSFSTFLVSEDAKTAALFIEHDLPPSHDNWEAVRDQIVTQTNEKLAQLQRDNPSFKFNATGVLYLNKSFVDIMQKDAIVMPILLHTFAFLILWWVFRSWKLLAINFILTNLCMLMTFGLQGWLAIPLTQINSPASVIVMTLVFTSTIHIWSGASGNARKTIQESWKITRKPILFTTVTTAVGFLSLSICGSLPFRELGYTVSLGLLASVVLFFGLLPDLCRLFSFNHIPHISSISNFGQKWSAFAISHHKLVLVSGLFISALFILQIPKNELNDSIKEYFPEDIPARQSLRIIEEQFKGLDQLTYVLGSANGISITSPEFQDQVSTFSRWLESQEEVIRVFSSNNVIKRLSTYSDLRYDDLSEEDIIEMLDLFSFSDSGEETIQRYFNFDQDKIRLTVFVRYMSSRENTDLYERINAWLKAQSPELTHSGTSVTVLYAFLGKEIIQTMAYGSLIALVCVTLLISFMFRSIKLGILSIFPNLFPPLILFGGWALFHGEVNMGVATVFAVSFGIIVDDTIHLLERLQATSQRLPWTEAVHQAFSHVGKAIITSSLMLSLGMFSLTSSDFSVASDMGLMIGSITLIALVFDLFIFSALLISIGKVIQPQARNAQ